MSKAQNLIKELDVEKRKIHLEERLRIENEASQLVAQACSVYECQLNPIFDKENGTFTMTVESLNDNSNNLKLCQEYINDVLTNYNVEFTPIIIADENAKSVDDIRYEVFLITTW